MKTRVLVMSVLIAVLSACSKTPYEKGEELAEKFNACYSDYNDAYKDTEDDFAVNFDASKYNSRKQAYDDYIDALYQVNRKYQDKWAKIEVEERKVIRDINRAERQEFEEGLYLHLHTLGIPDFDVSQVTPSQLVKNTIATIVPKLPSVEQMEKDLVGHSLSEGRENGYYPRNWKWTIEAGGISDVVLLSVIEQKANVYNVEVSMTVSSNTRSYQATAVVCYELGAIEDWTITMVNCTGMNIVRTHRYDDCVRCYRSNSLFREFVGENTSDVALEVAGEYLHYGQWTKFAIVLAPHTTHLISYSDVIEHHIDYVERP